MSPEEVVDRVYELISFSAGSEPDWPAHRALFTEPTVLALRVFPDDPQITVMDYDSYVVHQMRDGLSEEGYVEIPGERSTTIVGEAAVVLQEFAMKFRDRPPVPAFDAYSLVRVDGVWKIASVVSDMISAEALPSLARGQGDTHSDGSPLRHHDSSAFVEFEVHGSARVLPLTTDRVLWSSMPFSRAEQHSAGHPREGAVGVHPHIRVPSGPSVSTRRPSSNR